MVTKKEITSTIDHAEKIFESCWAALRPHGNKKYYNYLLHKFQPDLIEELFLLDSIYRKIIKEKKILILNKKKIRFMLFRKRIATLDKYLKIICYVIGIGRALGDGFAWIFYRNSRELLDKHIEIPPQKLMPPGVGGIGERRIIEKIQGFNGLYVISHAMTAMLRLGDVSFFDPRTSKIVSIAEIKTSHVSENNYRTTLTLIVGKKILDEISNLKFNTTPDNENHISQKMRERLDRQLKQITEALSSAKEFRERLEIKSNDSFYFTELTQAIRSLRRKKFSYVKAGKSLLIGTFDVRKRRKLASYLVSSNQFDTNMIGDIENSALQILDSGVPDNSLIISQLAYDEAGMPIVARGTIPTAFWPVDRKIAYQILFHRVMVISLYNPAHFWQELRNKGFDVHVGHATRSIEASKTDERRRITLGNLEYFQRFTSHFLMSDQAVTDMLDIALAHMDNSRFTNMKMDILPIIRD